MLRLKQTKCCCRKYFITLDKKENVEYKEDCKICNAKARLLFDNRILKGEKAVQKLKSLLRLGLIIPIENIFDKLPKEHTALTFIPLKHYAPINDTKQKEMYCNGDATGFKFESPLQLSRATAC